MKIEAVIFDCGRTLYDPEALSLFPGTRETLENLTQKGIKLGLMSVAVTDDITPRMKEIERFEVGGYFQAINIVPRSTVGKDFSKVLKDLGMEDKAESCLIVGDNLKREIESGNKIGAYTVWTTQDLSADWKPLNEMQIPKAQISNIVDLVPLIERLNN